MNLKNKKYFSCDKDFRKNINKEISFYQLALIYFYNTNKGIFIYYPKQIYYKNIYIDLDYFYKIESHIKNNLVMIKFLITE